MEIHQLVLQYVLSVVLLVQECLEKMLLIFAFLNVLTISMVLILMVIKLTIEVVFTTAINGIK
jgi:hypothetical protein